MATFASLGLASLESHGLEAVSRLGGGAAAEVLLACRLGRPEELCVVKTVALRGLDSRGRLRALQEVQALKKLRHPNVAVYLQSWWNGVGPNSGRLTTVTEYAEDGDLRAPLAVGRARDEALEGPVVAGWLQQILQGLEHVHSHGIVHRNLKPANVFLKGRWRICLLSDFDVLMALDSTATAAAFCGDPAYSAPELLWNQRCSPAADLWAAGVILHELLALRLPFEAPSAVELVRQVAFAPLELCGVGGSALAATAAALLSKEPAQRPGAAELLGDEALWLGLCPQGPCPAACEAFARAQAASMPRAEDNAWAAAGPLWDHLRRTREDCDLVSAPRRGALAASLGAEEEAARASLGAPPPALRQEARSAGPGDAAGPGPEADLCGEPRVAALPLLEEEEEEEEGSALRCTHGPSPPAASGKLARRADEEEGEKEEEEGEEEEEETADAAAHGSAAGVAAVGPEEEEPRGPPEGHRLAGATFTSTMRMRMSPEVSLEQHGYVAERRLGGSSTADVLVVSRLGQPGELSVVKSMALRGLDPRERMRVLQEIKILKRLRHPSIIRYVESWWNGVGPESGRLTVVMEFAEDRDLREPVNASLRLGTAIDDALVLLWLRQMLEGLSYVHGQNILHRDLKSMNVFLKESWRVCLLGDFGISTALKDGESGASGCVGTPGYMAPELVYNQRYSFAVDMWAIGVILYELMALRLPFRAESLLAVVYQIAFTSHDEAPLRDSGRPDPLVALVALLLSKEPSARPGAGDLLADSRLWTALCEEAAHQAATEACVRAQASSPARGGQGTGGGGGAGREDSVGSGPDDATLSEGWGSLATGQSGPDAVGHVLREVAQTSLASLPEPAGRGSASGAALAAARSLRQADGAGPGWQAAAAPAAGAPAAGPALVHGSDSGPRPLSERELWDELRRTRHDSDTVPLGRYDALLERLRSAGLAVDGPAGRHTVGCLAPAGAARGGPQGLGPGRAATVGQ